MDRSLRAEILDCMFFFYFFMKHHFAIYHYKYQLCCYIGLIPSWNRYQITLEKFAVFVFFSFYVRLMNK